MKRDDSWLACYGAQCGADCSHWFTTCTSPTGPFLFEWVKSQPRNTQNGKTTIPIVNLMADSESGSPGYHSSFLGTWRLSRLVSEIIARDRQTTQTITIACPPLCGGPANNSKYLQHEMRFTSKTQWFPSETSLLVFNLCLTSIFQTTTLC